MACLATHRLDASCVLNSFKCGDAVCNEKDIECGWELLQVLQGIVLRNQFGNALILFSLGCWE